MQITVSFINAPAEAEYWQVGYIPPLPAVYSNIHPWGEVTGLDVTERTAEIADTSGRALSAWAGKSGEGWIAYAIMYDVVFDPNVIYVADFATGQIYTEQKNKKSAGTIYVTVIAGLGALVAAIGMLVRRGQR